MSTPTTPDRLDVRGKALAINLDSQVYGTFAEIGAGQEAAAWFFRVGGAAGTVAKTMSAYDMKFSDEIYGRSSRYVSRDRVHAMLDHEYGLLAERLGSSRGSNTTFFVFADTVSARNYYGTNECHGWVGMRFQTAPGAAPCQIVLHVNLTDEENLLQQQALGVLGVNLVYAAFYLRSCVATPELAEFREQFYRSLLDDISPGRVEIDVIEFSGPEFAQIDNRAAGVQLLRNGLANAIMFDVDTKLVQPSEELYKRPVLVERGYFRASRGLQQDQVDLARIQFAREVAASDREPVSLLEMSIHNVVERDSLTDSELIDRVTDLIARKYSVIVTTFPEYFHVTTYLRRYTAKPIGFIAGASSLVQILNEDYYRHLEGGLLEAIGRLLSYRVKMYAYAMSRDSFAEHLKGAGAELSRWIADSTDPVRVDDLNFGSPLEHLVQYLLGAGVIVPVE